MFYEGFKKVGIFILIFMAFHLQSLSAMAADAKSVARVALGEDGSKGSSTGEPDLFNGAMSYSIPIEVPAGRNGMDPALALKYQSNKGNGWLGVGWDLEVGAIQRSLKDGVNFSGNSFQLVKPGEVWDLVDVGPGSYLTKIEADFSQINKRTATDGKVFWTVIDKLGRIFSFGTTTASRQDDPANPDRIYKWCLDRVEDTDGNYMTFSYFKDQGEIYLSKVSYTGNSVAGMQTTNFVKFNLETRNDACDGYSLNFKVRTGLRLKSIEVSVGGGGQGPIC